VPGLRTSIDDQPGRKPADAILNEGGFMNLKKLFIISILSIFGFLGTSPIFGKPDATPGMSSPLRYEIWVELDDAQKMLRGKENISWVNQTKDEVNDMWFHLYYNAFKNEQSTFIQESREGSFFGGGRVKDGEWGWVDVSRVVLADGRDLRPTMEFMTVDRPVHAGDQTVMRVRFPEPLEPGAEVHLQIEFQSKIPATISRSGYYQNSYFMAQWFPKPGVYEEGKGWNCHEYHLNSEFFADFADFTVHITVPSQFVVGASGKESQSTNEPQQKTTTYTYIQSKIHDFAWTADPDFIKLERDFIADKEVSSKEYEETALRLGLPVDQVRLPDVRMILLLEPEHRGQIERHFKALRMALKYYGLWYGPYPYETITLVDPPFRTRSGGMEYPTLFTAGTSVLTSKDVLSPEGVIIHEFGHGYWYGLVANNEFEEAWLDEGINTYSTGKVQAVAYGRGAFSASLKGIPLNWFFSLPKSFDWESDRAAAINIVKSDPIVTKSWLFDSQMSYGLNVYMRAATCLNTLERLVGPDVMLRIMRAFQTRFRFKHPQTRDFITVVNEFAGKDMSWFFEEFFYNTLNFDYGIASLSSFEKPQHSRGVFDIGAKKEEMTTFKIDALKGKEKTEKGAGLYVTEVKVWRYGEAKVGGDAKVKIKVVFDDGSEEERVWDGQGRWAKFVLEKRSKADFAQVDPAGVWLIDSNLSNNSLKRQPTRLGVFRLAARWLFFLQNLFQSFGSLG
jgi:hypothetical protein